MTDDGFLVIDTSGSGFSSDFSAVFIFGASDEVHGHVLRSCSAPWAAEILVEHDIKHPMKWVLDVPMTAHGFCEQDGVDRHRTEEVSTLFADVAGPFDLGFDHGDGLQSGKMGSPGNRRSVTSAPVRAKRLSNNGMAVIPIMGPARCLSVDGHHLEPIRVGQRVAQTLHSVAETLGEKITVDGGEHVGEGVVAGNTVCEGRKTT